MWRSNEFRWKIKLYRIKKCSHNSIPFCIMCMSWKQIHTGCMCRLHPREPLKGCLTHNTAFNAEIWVVALRVRAESHTSVTGPPSNHEVQQYRMIELRDHFTKEFGQIWNLRQRVRITDTQPLLHCKRGSTWHLNKGVEIFWELLFKFG